MKLYKVLVDGKSCHGGEMEWSLPQKKAGRWVAGDWHAVDGDIKICERGLHLTTQPEKWLKVGCTTYLAEAKDIVEEKEDKVVARSARLLSPVPNPKWWDDAEKFIKEEIPNIPYFNPDGKPKKEWRVFPNRAAALDAALDAAMDAAWDAASDAARDATRDAAWDAAWDAARDSALGAARDATRDAAWDAALFVAAEYICRGTKLARKHREHARKRMEVWRKGYGLLCDVGGGLFVYERP